jgi:hypothetical protein
MRYVTPEIANQHTAAPAFLVDMEVTRPPVHLTIVGHKAIRKRASYSRPRCSTHPATSVLNGGTSVKASCRKRMWSIRS